MKTRLFFWYMGLVFALETLPIADLNACDPHPDSIATWLQPWLADVSSAFEQLRLQQQEILSPLQLRRDEVNRNLYNPANCTAECGFPLLWERIQLDDRIKQLEAEKDLNTVKLRFRKGVEIVKMLYEKILSMDHYFTGLKAQQELLKMSNPHNYPEFKEAQSLIEERVKKKFGFALPDILQSNPYLSATFSLVGLVVGGGEDKEKKANVEKIACVMDFTVRMHNDMSVVYYETRYLRDANLTLKKDCEALFAECARQVGYNNALENCRNSDDWELLYMQLDNLVSKVLQENKPVENASNGLPAANPPGNTMSMGETKLLSKTETNLQFAIDRILQFTNRYSDFVNQSNEYYKKFAQITSDYENEKSCSEVLPDQFLQLRQDIEQTLEKFNSAYRIPEVQGSKLKDMLYGTGDAY